MLLVSLQVLNPHVPTSPTNYWTEVKLHRPTRASQTDQITRFTSIIPTSLKTPTFSTVISRHANHACLFRDTHQSKLPIVKPLSNANPSRQTSRLTGLAPLTILFLTLIACSDPTDTQKPTSSISSPASDATVSSTVPIQVTAQDDKSVTSVRAFARARGSTSKGFAVGSSVKSPYVISWNTTGVPNLADLEVYSQAEDGGGNIGVSDPVRVKVQNAGVPNLRAFTAFTYPPQVPVTAASLNSSSSAATSAKALEVLPFALSGLNVSSLQAPEDLDFVQAAKHSAAQLKASGLKPTELNSRNFALEWEWDFFQGADGFGVYRTEDKGDLAGPYTRQANQAAATSGVQKRSSNVTGAVVGGSYYGLISAITGGRTTETGFSNADSATFIGPQDSNTPAEGSSVTDGKPILNWQANAGVVGYLYYVYDKSPWDATASLKWSNSPKSVKETSASYPSTLAALPKGTYYWWVAGVSFDSLGKADALSFSEPKKFIVP
jgi:hypothetical protein